MFSQESYVSCRSLAAGRLRDVGHCFRVAVEVERVRLSVAHAHSRHPEVRTGSKGASDKCEDPS